MLTSKVIIKVVNPVTDKGNVTLKCSVKRGIAHATVYVLSDPDSVKEHSLKEEMDITKLVEGFKSVNSEMINEETGVVSHFTWLTPQA